MPTFVKKLNTMKTEILENPMNKKFGGGWGCGYVTIPKNAPAYKLAVLRQKTEEGGYTFYFQPPKAEQQITFCEFTEEGLKIGFDTSHTWNGPKHDKDYVKAETEKLKKVCEAITERDLIKAIHQEIAELTAEINELLLF